MGALKWVIIISVVLLLAVGIYIGITAYQGIQLVKLAQDESLRNRMIENANAVMSGDCTKLYELEKDSEMTRKEIESGCANPVLKKIIDVKSPAGINLCEEVKNPDGELNKRLNDAREKCANQTAGGSA